jgi:hypothetical protein
MSNLDKCGNAVGTMSYGNIVQVWCQSLDGGPTDSRIFSVEFPSDGNALLFASWFKLWTVENDRKMIPLPIVLRKATIGFGGTFH